MPVQQSIARDLFLLLTREKDGADVSGGRTQAVTVGALTDLVIAGRVTLGDQKDPLVHVADASPTSDPVLDDLLARLADFEGKKISAVVGSGKLNLTDTVGEDLVEAGALRRKKGWVFTYWPEADGTFETNLRAHLGRILRGEAQASVQDSFELSILEQQNHAYPLLKDQMPEVRRKDLDARIIEIAKTSGAEADPALSAVKKSVSAMEAAIMAAVFVPAVTAST